MINSIQNGHSAAAQVSNQPAQPDFLLACASASAKGVAVLPIGRGSERDIKKILDNALALNNNKPLDQIVFTHNRGDPDFGILNVISLFKDSGFIAESGTFALKGASYDPMILQEAADRNPGLKIAHQDPLQTKGVTVYEHGKKPRFDPKGSISDGGFGARGGCGTKPGYHP